MSCLTGLDSEINDNSQDNKKSLIQFHLTQWASIGFPQIEFANPK